MDTPIIAKIKRVYNDPSTSDFFIDLLIEALTMDPCDAANQLEIAANLLSERANEVLASALSVKNAQVQFRNSH